MMLYPVISIESVNSSCDRLTKIRQRSDHQIYSDIIKLSLYNKGIFVDLAKAFDTVNHKILINKLNHYGIRGTSLKWFESYLNNRQQYVQIETSRSKQSLVSCGVPQGSILGPLLFLIYINDLNDIVQKSRIIMFADDTNLFFSGKSASGAGNSYK